MLEITNQKETIMEIIFFPKTRKHPANTSIPSPSHETHIHSTTPTHKPKLTKEVISQPPCNGTLPARAIVRGRWAYFVPYPIFRTLPRGTERGGDHTGRKYSKGTQQRAETTDASEFMRFALERNHLEKQPSEFMRFASEHNKAFRHVKTLYQT